MEVHLSPKMKEILRHPNARKLLKSCLEASRSQARELDEGLIAIGADILQLCRKNGKDWKESLRTALRGMRDAVILDNLK